VQHLRHGLMVLPQWAAVGCVVNGGAGFLTRCVRRDGD